MAGLQGLEAELGSQGLHVLGFLSNDFGSQGGSEEDIDACTEKYAVTFEQFALGHVIDPDGGGPEAPQPVWEWILSQPSPGPASGIEPTWNFHKYLIARDGTLVAHFPQHQYPGDDPGDPSDSFDTNPIVVAIQAELAK
jgi:glutathione peroxidase